MLRTRMVVMAAFMAVMGSGAREAAADQYKFDPGHTAVVFKISHLGMSETYGRFNDVTGSFTLASAEDDGSGFEVAIKTASVDTGNKKRDDHLRSPDFFNANQFPVITYKTTKVQTHDGRLNLTGDLTLHGVTKEVAISLKKHGEGKDPWGNYRAGFSAKFTIKRSDFGMAGMPDAIGDEVTLMVSFEGIRE